MRSRRRKLERSVGLLAAVSVLLTAQVPQAVQAEPGRRVAAELETGRIGLEVYAERGEFMLWLRDGDGEMQPLLFPGDPGATRTTVRDGARTLVLGRSARLQLEQTEVRDPGPAGDRAESGGAGEPASKGESATDERGRAVGRPVVYQRFGGEELEIERVFEPIRSRGAEEPDAVRVVMRLHNRSEHSRELGVRLLLDTHLGEDAPREVGHFRLHRATPVRFEHELHPERDSVRYWFSRSPEQPELTLQQSLLGEGVTTPDRVVFANWKRLYESSWDYRVLPARRFSAPPYSLNDSAVAVYYDPIVVEAGETREIAIVLGGYAPTGHYELEEPPVDVATVREPEELEAEARMPAVAALRMSAEERERYLEKLEEINALIEELDRQVEHPAELTRKRLDELRERLEELRSAQ